MNRVSVIVPVYNSVRYIEKCARCLFEQTMKDVQLIFVDDGSTDGSAEYLAKMLDEYPGNRDNTIIKHFDINRGQARCREDALKLAEGEYVCFCDSDDWVESSFVQKMYDVAKKNNCDIVSCDIRYWRGNEIERVWGHRVFSPDEFCSGVINATYSGSLCNKMFRKSLLSSDVITPEYNMGEDWALCVQYASYAERVSYVEDCYYNVNIRIGSSSFSDSFVETRQRYEFFFDNYCKVTSFLKLKGLESLYHNDLVRRCLSLQFSLLPYIDRKEALTLWRNTSQDMNMEIMRCPIISIKEKLVFVAVSSGIYAKYRRMKTFFK